ncbi:zinc-binding alcohol dehydrogenase family protein [Actinoallomurus spadix]|uniref:Zinc-binding alcohol dehydrogenase family protein n=2 Tax=Actinoallomurus spadix TaxID=79912 RepID=A0ABP3GV47_9ACTN|nr:zinc-binding alcohol dehydrogenase family protein [Actinoallomurus spadix]MCO5986065.1 zinc-binding alcohol dehydrogenase family protein [Actinoallomurus spadix]
MKAAVLKEFGSPLSVEDVPEPVLGTGEVIVDVVAAAVLPYAAEVFSGERRYPLTLPVTPGAGAVGRVREVGPDATRLAPGQWVLCDPTIRSRDHALTPDIALQGLSARGDGGLRLQRHFGQGSYAERLLIPTENAVPLGPIDPADAARWLVLTTCLVPYGGLLAGGLEAGETVLVSGATGNFGGAAVAVALAMGAARVVAPGRNEEALTGLERRFGAHVRTVRLTGDEERDRERMTAAAHGPIDLVLDLLPPTAGTTPVRAAAMTVREYGRVVLMGGVGMLDGADLPLPYRWLMRNNVTVRGQWMFPRHAPVRLIELARCGRLDLGLFALTEFALDDAGEAVAHAARHGAPFGLTVIRP